MLVTAFGHKKIGTWKIKKLFCQDKFYSLKAYAHYFTILVYLAPWRAVKLGFFFFFHFIFTNLPWCSQSINSLMYVYSIQIPSCFLWVLNHSYDCTCLYYRRPKNYSVLLPGYVVYLILVYLRVCLMVNMAQSFLILHFRINFMLPLVTLCFPWLILFYFFVSCCC